MGTATPWGISDHTTKLIPGIVQYGTPSHGGVHISKGKVEQLPEWAKGAKGIPSASGGIWYEEDCACVIPYLAFNLAPIMAAQAWRKEGTTAASLEANFEKTLANYFPELWEKKHGRKLLPGESWANDERLFKEANKENWVVTSASAAPEGMTKCWAKRGGRQFNARGCEIDSPFKIFLVDGPEYGTRSPYGFVIDLARHREIAA